MLLGCRTKTRGFLVSRFHDSAHMPAIELEVVEHDSQPPVPHDSKPPPIVIIGFSHIIPVPSPAGHSEDDVHVKHCAQTSPGETLSTHLIGKAGPLFFFFYARGLISLGRA